MENLIIDATSHHLGVPVIVMIRRLISEREPDCPAPIESRETAETTMRLTALLTALMISTCLLLGGCGLFGCSGAATNGAALGGCYAGARF